MNINLPLQTKLNSCHVDLTRSDTVRDDEWDDYLLGLPNAHFEQHSGWAAVRAAYGWDCERWILKKSGVIVGGVQALTRRLGRWGTIGYVSRGPLVNSGSPELDEVLALHVETLASRSRWLYCVFDYPYSSHRLANSMAGRGFIKHPPGLPPSNLLDATLIVDLSPAEEEIIGRMNVSVRRNVRRSLRSDLTFTQGGFSDLARFRELMLSTCARRNSAPTPPQPDYFERVWREYYPREAVRLFLVRCGDDVISAAFAFSLSDTLRVWKVGWSGTHGDKDPNHYMWWQMMRWAKSHNFKALDFVWIDTEDAKLAVRGERNPDAFRDGTSYFKLGFGGNLLFPPPVQSKFFHPALRFFNLPIGARVLRTKRFQRIISSYWSKKSRG